MIGCPVSGAVFRRKFLDLGGKQLHDPTDHHRHAHHGGHANPSFARQCRRQAGKAGESPGRPHGEHHHGRAQYGLEQTAPSRSLENRRDPDIVPACGMQHFFFGDIPFSQKHGIMDSPVTTAHQFAFKTGPDRAQRSHCLGSAGYGKAVNPSEPGSQFSV